jgi:hypothetical protein
MKQKERKEEMKEKIKELYKDICKNIKFLNERQEGINIIKEVEKIPFPIRNILIDYGRRETFKHIEFELRGIISNKYP